MSASDRGRGRASIDLVRSALPGVLADAIVAGLVLLLVAEATLSLGWRMVHDAPLMLYLAHMATEQHRVMYRDIVDVNLPGTYLVNAVVLRLFGASDLGFRIADLLYLAAVLAVSARALAPLGMRAAAGGAALVGTMYLGHGSSVSMQREMLGLLPVGGALALWSSGRFGATASPVLTGALFGMAAWVKPQVAIGLPVVLAIPSTPDARRAAARLLLGGAGFLAPAAVVTTFLAATGGLAGFLDMAVHYWPLYGEIDGANRVMAEGRRATYLLAGYVRVVMALGPWLLPAVAGVVATLRREDAEPRARKLALLVTLLAVVYSAYPVIEGRFWPYQRIPYAFFLALAASFALAPAARTGRPGRLLPPAMLAAALALGAVPLPVELRFWLEGRPLPAPKGGKVDAIAAFLGEHLAPGETVQPLDWSGGAVHAMLVARAPIATSFIYDHYFYHHVSNPYIKGLRRRFIAELAAARPRFIVEITRNKPWVRGRDTTRRFAALHVILRDDYQVALAGNGFVIHERRTRLVSP